MKTKAILTGHSRGLGAAIADELLARGIAVLGVSRQRSAEGVRAEAGALLSQRELDLSDTAAVARWLADDELRAFLADADTVLLVNNAGTVQPMGPLGMQDPTLIARAVSLNVATPLMLADALVKATAHAADRRILHVSSGAGRNVYPAWNVYCATKAALDMHASAVASDGTPALKICSLAPGVIDTDMQGEIRATALDRFPMRERFQAMKRDGALIAPQDCARRLVAYLTGDSFGQVQVADLRVVAPA